MAEERRSVCPPVALGQHGNHKLRHLQLGLQLKLSRKQDVANKNLNRLSLYVCKFAFKNVSKLGTPLRDKTC
jgi:hypothetical protein